jgi:predicted RecB family nuclease
MSCLRLDDPERAQPDPEASECAILAEQGIQHEHAVFTQLRAEGCDVYPVPQDGDRTARTVAAMQASHPIIYQGELARGDFMGIADFLVRVEGTSALGNYRYKVWEAKCTRVAQPAFLLQLCCYADVLEAVQGRRPTRLWLVLGDRKPVLFRTEDYFYYYRVLTAAFFTWMTRFDPQIPPEPELGGTCSRWTSYARARLDASDHLSRVATITQSRSGRCSPAGGLI